MGVWLVGLLSLVPVCASAATKECTITWTNYANAAVTIYWVVAGLGGGNPVVVAAGATTKQSTGNTYPQSLTISFVKDGTVLATCSS